MNKPLFELPKSSRREWAFAALHIGMLAVALLVAWQKDGPPADKAFWAIITYFVLIAIAGALEIFLRFVRRSNTARREAGVPINEQNESQN
jgi:hypothetical protein